MNPLPYQFTFTTKTTTYYKYLNPTATSHAALVAN